MTTRRALAIGCGGTLGFAWTVVALRAVEQALDWDARTAEVLLGTSAGAELVAALGAGRTPRDLLAALDGTPDADPMLLRHFAFHPGALPPLPAPALPGLGLIRGARRAGSPYGALAGLLPRGRGDAGRLREYGAALAGPDGWVTHPDTWLVAVDTATGARTAFGSPDAPRAELGAAIAASWAIPGWFPPVRIGGRDYLDGGALSSVSADLLASRDLDEVVVIAPMTSANGAPARGVDRLERLLRAPMTRGLDGEIARLRAAGIRVIRVEPTAADLAAMGPNFMDVTRRPATLAAARRTTPGLVADAILAADRAGAAA
ncbi:MULTISPECIES: patatin-like phospholipase family protein [Nocardia]|uniref:patatin-like phospholipase family protein n=1 Tax=Nocardia TaxID=1817 RepID=UPI001894A7B8|nr:MULTISPECIES: patatin-like phospholipase family protein [Nocardia]MBF6184729.1 patatin-like phospholipase family protein [Nocardia farcinica]MBF6246605.1 patatin-like phospholipase family protein [Nocardia elegans]MBF6310573.1 patatin-like phospholipase family protein [Nocardia farcinica]MBF6405607.1 patatin-like phospholipase family protein [Nocardia farcinica]UEX24831.1 patatin-like phospholipase family protein [Nocardia farcinica]